MSWISQHEESFFYGSQWGTLWPAVRRESVASLQFSGGFKDQINRTSENLHDTLTCCYSPRKDPLKDPRTQSPILHGCSKFAVRAGEGCTWRATSGWIPPGPPAGSFPAALLQYSCIESEKRQHTETCLAKSSFQHCLCAGLTPVCVSTTLPSSNTAQQVLPISYLLPALINWSVTDQVLSLEPETPFVSLTLQRRVNM